MASDSDSPPRSARAGEAQSIAGPLPLRGSLKPVYLLSLLVAGLTAGASIAGLRYPSAFYPTVETQQSFLTNDMVNLFIGLPILLGSMGLARRGRLAGLLFWPGALLYGVYIYLVYLIGIPLNPTSLLYLGIVALSVAAILGLVAAINGEAVREQLEGRVHERLAGGYLLAFGVLFLGRAAALMAGTLISQNPLTRPELGLLVADVVLSAASIAVGVMLWRHQVQGYILSAGFLFQSITLFAGLIIVLLSGPVLTGAPLGIGDVIIVFVMGLVCSIPFILFLRGVLQAQFTP